MYNGELNGASIHQVYVKNIKFNNSYFTMNILSSITMDQFILRDFILIYSIKDSKWFDVLIFSNLFYHDILIQLGFKKKKKCMLTSSSSSLHFLSLISSFSFFSIPFHQGCAYISNEQFSTSFTQNFTHVTHNIKLQN